MVLFDLRLFLTVTAFILNASLFYCQNYPDNKVDSTLTSGISQIILQNYTDAEKIFKELDKDFPGLPLGKIYLAAVQIAKSYDYGEEYDESFIDSLLELAENQSSELVDTAGNIWNKYFLGLSEGYISYFKALTGDWINSLNEGINALRDFDELVKQDKNFYEAYIAIGTFKYWKSRKTEFLNWIPGYTDERDEGVSLLEKAIKHPTYNMYLAVNSLIWIYIDQGKYIKAADLAENTLKQYPGSRFFMWGLARAYEDINIEKSLGIYKEILNSLPTKSNHYNEIILKHIIAQLYARTGTKEKALHLCDEILAIKGLAENTLSRLQNRLKRVEELKLELSR